MHRYRHVIADLIRNLEVRGRARQQVQTNCITPFPLMGEESKPVPVPDTGSEGDSSIVILDLIQNP